MHGNDACREERNAMEERDGPAGHGMDQMRHMGDPLGRDLQKWIQCCKCEKWRKIPYSIEDDQIPDDWTCHDNVWDPYYNSCGTEQELPDDKIDAILQLQGEQELAFAQQEQQNMMLPPKQEYAGGYDDPFDDDFDDGARRGRRGGRWGRGRGRQRGKTGTRGRGSRGDSARSRGGKSQGAKLAQDEAAEALLGMVVGADNDMVPGVSKTPTERYYPGRLVWAKVEGHDWWPGKVVRRRAVPREVGLPPGGASATKYQIPVVFFTPSGIPGEGPASYGRLDAALEALKPLSAEELSADDEAEYAWLVADALKPFVLGDTSGDGAEPPNDELLAQCVEAANRAAASLKEEIEEYGEKHYDSDSDGGWGPQSNNSNVSFRGGRRGGRGGRGRKSRPGRRGRGRGGRWGRFEDDEGSDEDYEPGYYPSTNAGEQYGSSQKIVVESILGWRWKGSDSEGPGSKGEFQNMASNGNSEMENAVDALLAAADDDSAREMEFLVKYIGRSHIHNEWVTESTLMQIAKRKVLNFKKRYGCDAGLSPINLTDSSWSIPERFISRRAAPHGPGWEILVKWKGLGIENATWESETEPFMTDKVCLDLGSKLWERQASALKKSLPAAISAAKAKSEEIIANMPELTETPDYMEWKLMSHQIEALNWLRKEWAQKENCLLADEQGLGKTATILAFLRCLRVEFLCTTPFLIIAPSSSLGFWEGECRQWLGEDRDVVTYTGSAISRAILLENELWLHPSALDGRGVHNSIIKEKIPKADVVLTSHEAFASDSADLSSIQWGEIVFDERHRIQSASLKAYQCLSDFESR